REQRPASRKGLSGSGLGQRLREGYLAVAAREADRWIVVDNTDADIDQMVEHICDMIVKARTVGVPAAVAAARATRATTEPAPAARPTPTIESAEAALAAFLGWVDDRAQREPMLAAYGLAGLSGHGIDDRRG